jgi:hypothetical protein
MPGVYGVFLYAAKCTFYGNVFKTFALKIIYRLAVENQLFATNS